MPWARLNVCRDGYLQLFRCFYLFIVFFLKSFFSLFYFHLFHDPAIFYSVGYASGSLLIPSG
jgi:hypothetical protein